LGLKPSSLIEVYACVCTCALFEMLCILVSCQVVAVVNCTLMVIIVSLFYFYDNITFSCVPFLVCNCVLTNDILVKKKHFSFSFG